MERRWKTYSSGGGGELSFRPIAEAKVRGGCSCFTCTQSAFESVRASFHKYHLQILLNTFCTLHYLTIFQGRQNLEVAEVHITSSISPRMPPKVAFLMANYGHDPTGKNLKIIQCRKLLYSRTILETAVPYAEFRKAGFEIDFVTEKGNMPECDSKMLTGMTQKLLVGCIRVL